MPERIYLGRDELPAGFFAFMRVDGAYLRLR